MATGRSDPTPTSPDLSARGVRAFVEFFQQEAMGGILLLLTAVAALVWSNLAAASYRTFWHQEFTLTFGASSLGFPLIEWINDGLMAVFFLLVGLEIKREVRGGELSGARQAALPIFAALGGMVVPAALFALLNGGQPSLRGWGIPMATDIAFALGVLALLGSRVPVSVKVFLSALAIADDLGAVLVIALFYSGGIAWAWLGGAMALFGLMLALNRLGIRHLGVYGALFVFLWFAFHHSGIHATVAGVLAAFAIPGRSRIDRPVFVRRTRSLLDEFENSGSDDLFLSDNQDDALRGIERNCERVATPLQRLEHMLHPFVALGVMPVFALANAGIVLGADAMAGLGSNRIAMGVLLGLLVGKPLGIMGACWLVLKFKIADLPRGADMRHLAGASLLGGIGFTMSLFIAGLAFGEGPMLQDAKVGILSASLLSGLLGFAVLRSAAARTTAHG